MRKDRQLLLGTYNIRLGIQRGTQALAETIKTQEIPDILALQEVGNDWIMGPAGDTTQALSQALKLPHYFYVPALQEKHPDGRVGHYGHALLSRWPIQETKTIQLPQKTDEQRMLLQARIKTPFGRISIISTHLSHRSSDRPEQGAFLLNWLEEFAPERPRFLMGDLNATSEESWMQTLLASWEDADHDLDRPTYPAKDPTRRIDYILAQGATCLDVTLIQERAASDHRPLLSRWQI